MLKIKADKMKDLERMGFVENFYPKNTYYFMTNNILHFSIYENRTFNIRTKKGLEIFYYLVKADMVEKVVEDE